MSDEAIFSRRGAQVLSAVSAVTLAVTLYFMVFGEASVEITSAKADSFSRSALGYRALVELLENEVPVLVSRQHSEHKASPTTPLLLLEPPAYADALERLGRMIEVVRTRGVPTVVVLPKWYGFRSRSDRGWVSRVVSLPVDEPREVLRTVLGEESKADVVRFAESFPAGDARLPAPQLIRGEGLETVIGQGGHALVARVSDSQLYVISDPDLLNTAGLVRDGNALVVHELLLGRLSPQAFVIDEVLHGYGRAESLWNALLEFPLICVTLHLATCLLLGLWATTARFGRAQEPPSRLPPGKLTLVENTGRLLALAERGKYAVEHYLQLTVRRAARRVALPQAPLRQQVDRLAELGRRRGLGEDCENIDELARGVARLPSERVEPRRALDLSRALHRWRQSLEKQSLEKQSLERRS